MIRKREREREKRNSEGNGRIFFINLAFLRLQKIISRVPMIVTTIRFSINHATIFNIFLGEKKKEDESMEPFRNSVGFFCAL